MDNWPDQLASAISQIQQKTILQSASAGLRGVGAVGRLGAARNSIAVGRSTAEETLINKMAQAAVQGLNQPAFHPLAEQAPCCAARKASICPGELQFLGRGDQQPVAAPCHCPHAHHQLHAFPADAVPAGGAPHLPGQLQSGGRSFDRNPSYLHPNDAASLAASRPSWSAGNLASGNANLNVANQNLNAANAANNKNRELLALFVPRAGSLDA